MAGHVSLSSLPQPASPPSYRRANNFNPQLGITSHPLPSPMRLEPLRSNDWIYQLLTQIIQHPQFDNLFPFIKSCLQLNDQAWTTYFTLREDRDAKLKLHYLHSSFFYVPPDDVWSMIVRLRQRPTFSNYQPNVLDQVEQAYYRVHHSSSTTQFEANSRDGGFWNPAAQPGLDSSPGSVQTPSGSTFFPRDLKYTRFQEPDPGIHAHVPHSPPRSTASLGNSGCQKHRVRQAPDGMSYYCPSQGCSRAFKRLAHYTNHLTRNHPDFGPRHPNHSAEMSLRGKRNNSPSRTRPSNSVRFKDHPEAASEHDAFAAAAASCARSRRGSHLSLSSLNSIGVSSSAMDDTMDESLTSTEMPAFDSSMLHDSNVWHTGGATLLAGMVYDPNAAYFPGSGNG